MDAFFNRDKLILASASPRRSELLRAASIDFDVEIADVDESADCSISSDRLAVENALLKASSVANLFANRLVLGADTVVALDGKVYGKPRDIDEAISMLKILRGRTHSVFTGVALVAKIDGELRSITACGESKVSFKNLSEAEIRLYISKVNVMDKAGAYAAQEQGSMIIENIEGEFDNVMGLPVKLVKNLLDTARINWSL